MPGPLDPALLPPGQGAASCHPRHLPALQLQTLEELTGSGVPVTLLTCSGSLTGQEATRLDDQLLVQLRHGPRHLLLDLAEVTGIDAAAVAVLADAHLRAETKTCTFALVAASQVVLDRLQLTKLDRVLALHADLEQALTALEPARRPQPQ